MEKISKRILNLPFSSIRKFVPYAQDAKDNNVKVYHLNIGQPDIETPKAALNALCNFDEKIIHYGKSQGEKDLLDKLTEKYKKYNPNISNDDILITIGGSEALLNIFLTICDAHDQVIMPEPFYTNTKSFAQIAEVDIVAVTTTINNEFAIDNIKAFEEKINSKTKAIAICNPNNPTGYIYSEKELLDLLNLCEKYDLFLICDEVYREFTYDNKPKNSVLKYDKYKDRIIVVDSFSKLYSMCGSRIGMVISQNKTVINNMLKLSQARLSPPIIDQKIAVKALETSSIEVEETRKEYEERRNTLYTELMKIDNIVTYKPKGAFYLIVELSEVEDAEDFIMFMLTKFRYKGETVFVSPANGFYSSPNVGKNQIRIAYVLKKEDLIKSIKILKEGLIAYKKQK